MLIRPLTTPPDQDRAARLAYDVYVRELGVLGDIACHETRRLDFHGSEHTELLGAHAEDDTLVGSIATHFTADAPLPDLFVDALELSRLESVVDTNRMALVTRLIVRSAWRGKKVALRLMHGVWQRLYERGVQLVLADCQPHLLGLYRTLGFRPFGRLFNYGGSGVAVPLAALPADREYLVQNRCVGAKWVPPEHDDRELARRFADTIAGPAPVITPEAPAFWNLVRRAVPEAPWRSLARSVILNARRGIQLLTRQAAVRPGLLVLDGELTVSSGTSVERLSTGERTNGRHAADVTVTSERANVLFLGDVGLDRPRRPQPTATDARQPATV